MIYACAEHRLEGCECSVVAVAGVRGRAVYVCRCEETPRGGVVWRKERELVWCEGECDDALDCAALIWFVFRDNEPLRYYFA